jgi:Mg-chelatase subunit ChlD
MEEEKIQDQSLPTRPPIDLVCVVDISGSMEGEKLQLVKNSLRFLMKIMGPWDRLSIVTFESRSHIILPWTRNTPENKDKIKKIIKNI